jgi:cytochrome P450
MSQAQSSTQSAIHEGVPPLAAPAPPPKPLSLLGFARAVRQNFLAGLHADVYEQDIVEMKLAGSRIFIVNHPGGIRHVLLQHAANYPKARIEHRLLGPSLGNGLIMSEGATWRAHRRIMAPFFDQGSLARYGPIMVDAAERTAMQWGSIAPYRATEVCGAMMDLTLGVISRAMFSSDSDGMADTVRTASRDYQEAMMFDLPDFIPVVGSLWGAYKAARARRILRNFDLAIHGLIAERAAVPAGDARVDLLQGLIKAQDTEGGTGMTVREVRDQVLTIFVAGSETTALALTWTWYLLSQHPQIEARLHSELDATLGGLSPRYDDLPRLAYARMVIEEAMRLYPPVYSLTWREALEDDEICETRIPRGSIVAIIPWVLHRHRRLWSSPERFDPERFAPDASSRRERLSYLPFGFGPRVCLGASFAMAESVLVLATLARRYRLLLASTARIEPQALFTLRPRYGLHMVPEPRG